MQANSSILSQLYNDSFHVTPLLIPGSFACTIFFENLTDPLCLGYEQWLPLLTQTNSGKLLHMPIIIESEKKKCRWWRRVSQHAGSCRCFQSWRSIPVSGLAALVYVGNLSQCSHRVSTCCVLHGFGHTLVIRKHLMYQCTNYFRAGRIHVCFKILKYIFMKMVVFTKEKDNLPSTIWQGPYFM